jgi:hypothetical protein
MKLVTRRLAFAAASAGRHNHDRGGAGLADPAFCPPDGTSWRSLLLQELVADPDDSFSLAAIVLAVFIWRKAKRWYGKIPILLPLPIIFFLRGSLNKSF